MLAPKDIFIQSAEQLREIVWWNQNLTKLSLFTDTSELEDMLVETDGPYIEKVSPPAFFDVESPIPWNTFADRYDISSEIKLAVNGVLFKGEKDLPLYYHQGEAIRYLCSESELHNDLVLSVPTATGKTEAFLIPILDYCVKKRKEHERFERIHRTYDLKALIIYPMKSLEIDQLNRFIEYLRVINKELEENNHHPIRIGIWDGDTPTGVADIAGSWEEPHYSGIYVQKGDGARGLKCPIHKDISLEYFEDTRVLCPKGHTLNWVSMTREGIRSGVDILITNPEALSHLLISPKNKNVIISDDVKYIVIDEAHTWKGVSGSIFSIFLQRLRFLYESSKPYFILSSATIRDPLDFGRKLLNHPNVNVVGYKTFLDTINISERLKKANFRRIPFTRFDYTMFVLLGLDRISRNPKDLSEFLISQGLIPSERFVDSSLTMLQMLNLVDHDGNSYTISKNGREILDFIYVDSNIYQEGFESILETAFDSLPFLKIWTEIVCDVDQGLPEIVYLSERIFGNNQFMREADVLDEIQRKVGGISEKRAREILSTLLSFGRISRTIFDKYHFFQKPISSLYICLDCNRISPIPECLNDKSHKESMRKLMFCTKCHAPAFFDEKGKISLLYCEESKKICTCGNPLYKRNFRDVFLPYSAFTTYLLSVIANKIDPKKILVFGDGRQLVESIAHRTQNLDYSLVAQRIICYKLLTEGRKTLPDLYNETGNLLVDLYIDRTPLDILTREGGVYSLPLKIFESLNTIRSSFIRKIRYDLPTPRNRWFVSSVITFSQIENFGDPLEKAFVHCLLSNILTYQFYSDSRKKVGTEWFNIANLNTIKRRMERYQGFLKFFENGRFDTILDEIVDATRGLNKSNLIRSGNDEVTLEHEAIILQRDYTDLTFFVPNQVSYCENCYEGYPTTELDSCPFCLSELNKGLRFEFDQKGRIQGQGYLQNIRKDARWTLDHWAKDILGYSVEWLKEYPDPNRDWDNLVKNRMEYMVVLSHRSGIAQRLRSEIEEGFKRKEPTVHAVCATPTMELGIDIGTLNHICQIGIPPTKTNYVQRAGRTGRKMRIPSLIFTIIRNENEIDSYFLTDLSKKFLNRDLNPIFIPDPSASMLFNQIFVEILQYLNINQEETRSEFNKYYRVFPSQQALKNSLSRETVETIFDYVVRNVYYPLSRDVLRNYDKLINHLSKVFGPYNIDVEEYVNENFYGSNSRLMRNSFDVFERLDELYSETLKEPVKREFIDRNSVLGMFLGTLNMFTEFRGIGSSVPIYSRDMGIIELKSVYYALREGYPGPFDNNRSRRGAMWYVETRKFDITRVISKLPSLISEDQGFVMCMNAECDNPFETYPSTMESCPWCDMPLEDFEVYEYQYGEARHARPGMFDRTNTHPIRKTLIISGRGYGEKK